MVGTRKIDGMGEVNCLKKEANVQNVRDLCLAFVARIKDVVKVTFNGDTNPLNEVKVALDPYLKGYHKP